jgi:hypothetical protein
MKFSFFVLIVITLIIAVSGTTACEDTEQVDKPDLIIETVSYSNAPAITDEYGMPIMFPGIRLNFTICVRNIGDAAIAEFFYISHTRSNEAFNENYYESGEMVNHDNQIIEPGESLEVTITDNIAVDAKQVRFMVNPESNKLPPIKLDGNELDVSSKQVEESNYKNNTYELEIVP